MQVLRTILFRLSTLVGVFTAMSSIAFATTESPKLEMFRPEGLSAGNTYSSSLLRGTVTVYCSDRGRSDLAIYSCSRSTLDPVESAYFVTTPGGNATKVVLSCLHEDGTSQVKRSDFDAKAGQSKNWFNLWISTLFQRPLLKLGVNSCTFELSQNDGTVERRGAFEVNVARAQNRECPDRTIWSGDADDCSNGSLICERYFADENYCQ